MSRIDWCQRNSDPISKSSCFQPIQIPVLTKGDRFRQLFGEGSENAPNHYIHVKFYAWSIGDTLISWFEDLSKIFEDLSKSYEILKSCLKHCKSQYPRKSLCLIEWWRSKIFESADESVTNRSGANFYMDIVIWRLYCKQNLKSCQKVLTAIRDPSLKAKTTLCQEF